MTELFAGATSYWLVLAKSGGSAAGAAGGTCCPGGDGGGAASWAAFLGSGDLALAARAVRRRRGCGRSGGLATPDGKICAPCVIRGARAAKAAPSWQDLRAVYSQTAVCRAFRIHGAHILPKPARFRMHGVRILPRTGDFPVRGRFRDAWSAKLATDCLPGTHRGGILPRQGTRERIAREYCHCQSGQGRIRAQSRHRRTLGNAFREHFAIVERPGTHRARILPLPVARERIREDLAMDERLDSPAPNNCRPPRKKNGAEGRNWRASPRQKHERQSAGAAGASSGYGAVQRHRRTLGNAARRNIAMADNAPRDKRRRAFCSPSFAVLFTARVAIGAFAVGSRRHLAVSLIEAHIR